MKIILAKNAKWANEAHSLIELEAKFEELGDEFFPFLANPNDSEAHGRQLFQNAVTGIYGPIAEYVAPPTPPTPVPDQITTRQFLIAAALGGIITEQEAVDAATTGAVPALIASVFAQLPSEQAFAAQITWAKMTIIPRADTLVEAVGAALDMTSEQMDDFFIQAVTL